MSTSSFRQAASSATTIDTGLRSYMIGIYNYMAMALTGTGIIAWFSYQSAVVTGPAGNLIGLTAFGQAIYSSPLSWVITLSPLAFVLVLSFGVQRLSLPTVKLLFIAFAVAMGLSLSSIFVQFTEQSIARVFFISAGTFAGMSLYGYTTKRDLTRMGAFMTMGLIGIIIAMVVNIWLASPALQFAISILGVLIFVGLTAYDTQRLRNTYYSMRGASEEAITRVSLYGALTLYLDFLNLFLFLLQLFGSRR